MQNYRFRFLGLALILLAVWLLNISLGSVKIPFEATILALLGQSVENSSWEYIIYSYRLPKAVTAILVGGGLSLSGLLMQTLFRNPLAGPFVLGISSGASLGAALLLMGSALVGGLLFSDFSLVTAASLGVLGCGEFFGLVGGSSSGTTNSRYHGFAHHWFDVWQYYIGHCKCSGLFLQFRTTATLHFLVLWECWKSFMEPKWGARGNRTSWHYPKCAVH